MIQNMSAPHILNSPEAISQLIALASRAYERVPFYRQRFANLDFTSSLQFTDIPLLCKEDARIEQNRLIRSDHQDYQTGEIIDYTSGSTGIPLRLVRNQAEVMYCARKLWRARSFYLPAVTEEVGVSIFPIIQFGTSHVGINYQKKGKVFSTTLGLNIEHISSYLDELDALQPAWLNGPPALLAIVAEGLRRNGRRLRRQLSFVESTSDWLSPELRDTLTETFQCRVVNHYGCEETYTIAYECPEGKMHIFDDCVVVELHPHETGQHEIVVSSLIFETMPFIRYKVGDLIHIDEQPCCCGKSAPVLGQVEGRVSTVIAGTTLPGNHVFYQVVTWMAKAGFDSIQQYCVHQTSLHHFEVQLVIKDKNGLNKIAPIFQEMANVWLPRATFAFEAVDTIELTGQGKRQYFVCHV